MTGLKNKVLFGVFGVVSRVGFKVFIFALVILAGLNSASAEEISFLTHGVEGKTFRDYNGELRGVKHSGRRAFQLELVREMMAKLKFSPKDFHVIPFKRGLKMIADNKKPYAFFNAAKISDRMAQMKFVGPLTQDDVLLYERTSDPSGIQSLDQAKKYPLCVLLGSATDTMATNKGFKNIIRADYERCFKMLLRKRVKFATISNQGLAGVLKNAKINPDQIRSTSVSMYKFEGSLSFSNQIPDDVIEKWQVALDEIKQSGRYEELLKEYHLPN